MTAAQGFDEIDDHRRIFSSDGHGKPSVEQHFMTAAEGFCEIDDHWKIFSSDGHGKPSVEQHLMTAAEGFDEIDDHQKDICFDGHRRKQFAKSGSVGMQAALQIRICPYASNLTNLVVMQTTR